MWDTTLPPLGCFYQFVWFLRDTVNSYLRRVPVGEEDLGRSRICQLYVIWRTGPEISGEELKFR
jgi:hypothetical protein